MQMRIHRNMKRILASLLAVILILSLAACGSSGNNTQNTEINANTNEPSNTVQPENTTPSSPTESSADKGNEATGNSILVVYFSWSGHLDSMAHWVADETGGDIYRVTAKDPYPTDYNQTADRAKSEQDNDVRPEIVIDITEEQMAQYDTVFFGFPVWWYDLPMSMWTFLESYDFSGKTIIPFFSHEGSSNGAGALPTIEKLAEGATVKSDDALSIRGGKVDGSESDVRAWVQGLGYQKTAEAPQNEPAASGKALVVYYSASGNTGRVAGFVADELNADTFELVPVEPYSDADLNWRDRSSQWDGDLQPLAEAGTPIYMVTGENDSYYGSSSVRETYEKLVSLYKEMGFSEEQIDRLLVLDLKGQAWFDERGIRDQHGGGGSFAHEADIMGWLFGEH